MTLSLCPGLVCVAPSGQAYGRLAAGLILRGPLSLLSAANAAVCRRVLAVGRTGLLAGLSSACLGRALRKYDAASSGCPCPHPRRYPCHDPCRSPVRQRTRIGIRIGTRILMAHRHCRRPFLARSSCRGQRWALPTRTRGRQEPSCWPGHLPLASAAPFGSTTRLRLPIRVSVPHPRRYPCRNPCLCPVRQRTRIGIRIGTRIGTAHWRRCRPFLPSSSCRGQRRA